MSTPAATAERLSAFGRRCFFFGALFFAVISTAAQILDWGALITAPGGFIGGWLAYRAIDRLAARTGEVKP